MTLSPPSSPLPVLSPALTLNGCSSKPGRRIRKLKGTTPLGPVVPSPSPGWTDSTSTPVPSSQSALKIQRPSHTRVSSQVVDHYENPRNVGSLDKTSKNVGTGLVGAPACGDVMKLQIQVDEQGKIVDARFKTFGCGSAIASSSLATEWVKGKTVEEALTIKNTDIAKELCLPPVKLHCSMLAEDAIKAALADYKLKQEPKKGEAEKK
ncbi:iron-sulfur cluster assembly enzyme ISCU, mitochondrial isoform X1 [Panthera tigris]|uniref:iron-sulfur cluster assembly enzyme ISCU, mitochondrial isoform X1 n=1 Tax=Panthera tigris TaxID=9694 RepID=UPI001C6F7D99|nr:iron-sulfur cluster assembly enzyme ISCU, mitochondrial isoform X1 [Panthera tigris]XP_049475173.1 iron-sulfur cluster assembly enzyme ISCU isoform X1 [Panthera uncia]